MKKKKKVELCGGNLVYSFASEVPEMPSNILRAYSSHGLYQIAFASPFLYRMEVGPGLMPAGRAGDRGAQPDACPV